MSGFAKPEIKGAAVVAYRCAACHQPIEGEPVLKHIDGRLVALHPEHEEPETWPQIQD